MVHLDPIPPSVQRFSSTSLGLPQLTNEHPLSEEWDSSWVNSMTIGDMFLSPMYKSWEHRRDRGRCSAQSMSFSQFLPGRSDFTFCDSFDRSGLGTLGQIYDQYLDFAQQDAHEFLRIILDAMRMEEQDIIKKRQPPSKKRRRTTLTPADPRGPLASTYSERRRRAHLTHRYDYRGSTDEYPRLPEM